MKKWQIIGGTATAMTLALGVVTYQLGKIWVDSQRDRFTASSEMATAKQERDDKSLPQTPTVGKPAGNRPAEPTVARTETPRPAEQTILTLRDAPTGQSRGAPTGAEPGARRKLRDKLAIGKPADLRGEAETSAESFAAAPPPSSAAPGKQSRPKTATAPLAGATSAQPALRERRPSATRGLTKTFRNQAKADRKHRPPGDVTPRYYEDTGRDQFQAVAENPILRVADAPVSTFSVDVDTASYAFMRRMLNRGVLPQKHAVRIEELVNYFDYAYPLPKTRKRPFEATATVTPSPWKTGNKLIHIGIKGYDIDADEKPRSNLVFLLDVSGSMNAPDKLPLMVNSMKLLLDSLKPDDTVAIVVYAGAAGTVLKPTKIAEKHKILAALDRLRAGGSTAGAAGIRQAYALAQGTFDKKAVNRVILATDGDFNVGITNREELKGFVERKRKSGVFLSVFGFGQGNLNDHLMQTLAQNGNGVAAHIDTLNEARKVLVEEASSTLFPIAKDVKIQVEFNPATVAEYRLIGYETRALKREDFRNDKVDAGDIGAGHTVTAIYEITPVAGGARMIGESRYGAAQPAAKKTASKFGTEFAFLKIRYKLPDQDKSTLMSTPITVADEIGDDAKDSRRLRETRWATAVAAFGQLLKGGKYTGGFSHDDVIALARSAKGEDEFGYRAEFINLVRLARSASAGK